MMTVASLSHSESTGRSIQHQRHVGADAVRAVVLAAVSCILYVRCVLPEDHFVPMACDNVAFKGLRPNCSEAAALLYNMLDHGVYDAIQRQYLRTLTIAIIKSPKHREQSLESYHLHFSYPHPDPGSFTADAELVDSNNATQRHKLGHFDSRLSSASHSERKLLAKQVHDFMRSLTFVLHTLHTLPINCFMDMHLQYNDATPEDYQPMFFRTSQIVPCVSSPFKLSTCPAPVIETQWLSIKLDIETSASSKAVEPTEPLPSPACPDLVHLLDNPNNHDNTPTPIERARSMPIDANCVTFPQVLNSDDTILDDPEYAGSRAARRISQQPCETTAATADVQIDNDTPTQSQWPTQGADTAAHTDSGTQLDSETYLGPPMPAPESAVITLSSSDDSARPLTSSRASPLPLTSNEVDCLCQLNDSDGGMLQCESCHAWMHVVCYGYLYVKDTRLPERFLCAKCDVESDKFKGVSRSERRDLGLFRSAVSVIWNEAPPIGKKGAGKSQSRSITEKGREERDEHVWHDKQLAARLFIPIDQANKLLARAVDEHIASWHARGKISKRSQVLVVVQKQSNDARLALHVLFNPILTRLPRRGKGTLIALETGLVPVTAKVGANRLPTENQGTSTEKESAASASALVTADKRHGSQQQQVPKSTEWQVSVLSPAGSQTQVYSQSELDSFPFSPPTLQHHQNPDPRASLQPHMLSPSAADLQTQVCSQPQLDKYPLSPVTIHLPQLEHPPLAMGPQTRIRSEDQHGTFPHGSLTHPNFSYVSQPPPTTTTTGTVIPASISPPGTWSLLNRSQTDTGRGILTAAASSGHHYNLTHPASSLDLLRVTNHTQHATATATARTPLPLPHASVSPLLLMTHTTPAPGSCSVGAPGSVFGSQSTYQSLYQLHHRPAYAYRVGAGVGAGAAMTMTPPESSGTLKWMPDSQIQPLTDGSIELESRTSGQTLTRPGMWAGASPAMAVDDHHNSRVGKRKRALSGVTANALVDVRCPQDQGHVVRSKKVKRSAAQRPARMRTP